MRKKVEQFQSVILDYWQTNGRHFLPWRKSRNPWEILVAELLLRKTTTSQAEAGFKKLGHLTADEIARMSSVELESIFYPLGMRKVKAEQLQEIASKVKEVDLSKLKSDKFLRSMRGVGPYISNSVRCIAYGIPVPALDTNMIRLIERVFGWHSKRARAREDKNLWHFAESLVPKNACREYNWGVLDFGAAICTSRNPKCSICPLQDICNYYQELVS